MDTTELFASAWQRLKEQRQQLIVEGDRLKREFNNLPANPAISQLLEEKNQLKGNILALEDQIDHHQFEIDNMQKKIDGRHLAATNKQIQRELATLLKERQQRYIRLNQLDAPREILANERRLIWEIKAPLDEVERHYLEKIDAEKQKKQSVEKILQEALKRIAAIEEHYRQTKKVLDVAIQEIERRKQQLHEDLLRWASQDRDHLKWLLKHEPAYRNDVIRCYRRQFPSDNLADLLPPPTPITVWPRQTPKARRKKNNLPPLVRPDVTPSKLPAWRFFVTFNASDPGVELPQRCDQFKSHLQTALRQASYHSLSVQLVYSKLLAVTQMTTQQRQEMNKVMEAEPLGWKILRLGRKHRLFLSIDEDKHQIRFLPCSRKKSYRQR